MTAYISSDLLPTNMYTNIMQLQMYSFCNWSLVIPEAMACGLPVATSIYNGCYSELIKEDVNGTIFDPLKNDSMLKALEYFHHHDLKAMGQASIELEKPFNTENCAQREYDAIIRSLDKKTGK